MLLSRCEQEVVINFNVTEQTASVYCADPKYIRLMDRLVAEYPEVYKVTAVTDVSKTYSMPKAYLKIGKPRRVSAENVERARERLEKYNLSRQLRQENKEP